MFNQILLSSKSISISHKYLFSFPNSKTHFKYYSEKRTFQKVLTVDNVSTNPLFYDTIHEIKKISESTKSKPNKKKSQKLKIKNSPKRKSTNKSKSLEELEGDFSKLKSSDIIGNMEENSYIPTWKKIDQQSSNTQDSSRLFSSLLENPLQYSFDYLVKKNGSEIEPIKRSDSDFSDITSMIRNQTKKYITYEEGESKESENSEETQDKNNNIKSMEDILSDKDTSNFHLSLHELFPSSANVIEDELKNLEMESKNSISFSREGILSPQNQFFFDEFFSKNTDKINEIIEKNTSPNENQDIDFQKLFKDPELTQMFDDFSFPQPSSPLSQASPQTPQTPQMSSEISKKYSKSLSKYPPIIRKWILEEISERKSYVSVLQKKRTNKNNGEFLWPNRYNLNLHSRRSAFLSHLFNSENISLPTPPIPIHPPPSYYKSPKKRFVSKKFQDLVRISTISGKGGDGAVCFERTRRRAVAPAAGGNGGRGGSIYLQAFDDLTTLNCLQRPTFHAGNGSPGANFRKNGKPGQDITVRVPTGTIIHKLNEEGEYEPFIDLSVNEQKVLVAEGGKGGIGNAYFTTSTNRSPQHFTKGGSGLEVSLALELKLIADVGLVGLPNAGKSSFLNEITRARSRVDSYAFTTLQPYIGSAMFRDQVQMKVADIPGLISGASDNKGLGHSFLRHIERTRILLFIIDMSGSPSNDFTTLQKELRTYEESLVEKPFLILSNKMDLPTSKTNLVKFLKFLEKKKFQPPKINSPLHSDANTKKGSFYSRSKSLYSSFSPYSLNSNEDKYSDISSPLLNKLVFPVSIKNGQTDELEKVMNSLKQLYLTVKPPPEDWVNPDIRQQRFE